MVKHLLTGELYLYWFFSFTLVTELPYKKHLQISMNKHLPFKDNISFLAVLDLCYSLISCSFVKLVNSRRLREAGNMAILGETRVAYGILMGRLVDNALV
jgi:hypothetical protein